MKRRVGITGLGALTAAGEGWAALWKAALEKKSGIGRVSFGGHPSWEGLGAAVRDFVPEKYVTQKKSLKVMARDIQLAVAAANLAMQDSAIGREEYSKDRFGVIVGSGVLNHDPDELAYSVKNSLDGKGHLDLKKFGSEGLSALFPLWLLKYLPNMAACHISILFDLEGPNNSITTGASAGLQALVEAAAIIQRGDADLMLAGGAESKLNPVGYSEYQILGILSKETDPQKAGRSFTDGEGGIVIGEGAGFLVLEEWEHAKKRKAKIYAEVVGSGSSSDDCTLAMRGALKDSGLHPEDLEYLQACGIGILEDDRAEARAIGEVFDGSTAALHVGESKTILGFTGFAAGALDLLMSALVIGHQVIPPSMGRSEEISLSSIGLRAKSPVSKTIRHAMTNAFGFNGQSVSVILKSVPGEN